MYPSLGCNVVGSNQSFGSCDNPAVQAPTHDDATYIYGNNAHVGGIAGEGVIITGNYFHDINSSAPTLYLNECGSFTVYNNIIVSVNISPTIGYDGYNSTAGCAQAHIWNNTLMLTRTDGQRPIRISERSLNGLSVLDIQNNHIIHDIVSFCDCSTGAATSTIDHNLEEGLTISTYFPLASASGYTLGNLYTPQTISAPSVGTGVNLSSHFTVDYNNNPRTVPFDIGAHEFQTGTSTPGRNGRSRMTH
jgi:hypothetical protein